MVSPQKKSTGSYTKVMSNAVAIGYRDDILPFGVWGIKLMPVASTHELITTLDNVLQNTDLALIIISEALIKDSPGILRSYIARSPIPILVLPSHRGSYGTSLQETAGIIKKAIGIDVLEGV